MRTAIALSVLVAATVVSSASARGSASPGAAKDVRLLGAQLESIHPNLFRNVPRKRFRAEVERLARAADGLTPDELLVGLMRVAALPGARNGHTGLFPLDSHRRTLYLYPLRLYDFADGVHVVDEVGSDELIGSKLVTIAGLPVAGVLRRVAPLVPHDNASSLRGWAPHYALVAEVLDGLGIVDGVGPVTFGLESPSGKPFEATLSPVSGSEYVAAFADPLHGHYPASLPRRSAPRYLAESGRDLYLGKLAGGKVVYVGYNTALAPTSEIAARLERLTGSATVRRVIVDVRLNGGGDNTSYRPLFSVLASPQVSRRGRLFLLAGRATFSAAGNFAAEIDRYTRATIVGEPTGGGVNQYGDATAIALPATGWSVHIATSYVVRGDPGDRRLAVVPDVAVQVRAADFFAGRDPALARALKGVQ